MIITFRKNPAIFKFHFELRNIKGFGSKITIKEQTIICNQIFKNLFFLLIFSKLIKCILLQAQKNFKPCKAIFITLKKQYTIFLYILICFFKFKSLYPNVELDIYGSVKPNMQSDYQSITEYDVKMKMEFRSARFIVIKNELNKRKLCYIVLYFAFLLN